MTKGNLEERSWCSRH